MPAVEGRLIKAVTVFSTKWAPQPDGAVLLRARSAGTATSRRSSTRTPSWRRSYTMTCPTIVGRPLPAPIASTVTRWGGGLPQYAPGHLDRVASARAALPATIALAGAAYDGVGIPVCIRSGQAAAAQIVNALGDRA